MQYPTKQIVYHPIELLTSEIERLRQLIQNKIIFDIYFKDDYDNYETYLNTDMTIDKDEYNDPIITYFNFINDTEYPWTYRDHNLVVDILNAFDFKSKIECIDKYNTFKYQRESITNMHMKVIDKWFEEDYIYIRKHFHFK